MEFCFFKFHSEMNFIINFSRVHILVQNLKKNEEKEIQQTVLLGEFSDKNSPKHFYTSGSRWRDTKIILLYSSLNRWIWDNLISLTSPIYQEIEIINKILYLISANKFFQWFYLPIILLKDVSSFWSILMKNFRIT